jgi:hypothetical protein
VHGAPSCFLHLDRSHDRLVQQLNFQFWQARNRREITLNICFHCLINIGDLA